MRVYGPPERIAILARAVDAACGYPRQGLRPDGSPGPGWTLRQADVEVADDGMSEYPADVPERARHLLTGLPQRKHKPRLEPTTIATEDP